MSASLQAEDSVIDAWRPIPSFPITHNATYPVHSHSATISLLETCSGGTAGEKARGGQDVQKTVWIQPMTMVCLYQKTWLLQTTPADALCMGDVLWTPVEPHGVARISALTTKNPSMVQKMVKLIWMYLVNTCYNGIKSDVDGSLDLVVYTDASYEKDCHGSVVILCMGAPILWRSSRQALATTSTAACPWCRDAGGPRYEATPGISLAGASRADGHGMFLGPSFEPMPKKV